MSTLLAALGPYLLPVLINSPGGPKLAFSNFNTLDNYIPEDLYRLLPENQAPIQLMDIDTPTEQTQDLEN